MSDLETAREQLERLTGLPAEIDREAREPQAGVDFRTPAEIEMFEREARSPEITGLLKRHRQEVCFQAFRHTFIQAKDDRVAALEHFWSECRDHGKRAAFLKELMGQLDGPLQKELSRQMGMVVATMKPSLKLRISADTGEMIGYLLSLIINETVDGEPAAPDMDATMQARVAVQSLCPGLDAI